MNVCIGALPIVPAVYPEDRTPLPVVYHSPACDSVAYDSVLACPKLPGTCPDTPARGDESGTSEELTGGGHVGTRALSGVVGVRCDGMSQHIGISTDNECLCYTCADYSQLCEYMDLRLTFRDRSGATGNLEICFITAWLFISSNLLDQKAMNVACRSLGFTGFEESSSQPRLTPAYAFPSGASYGQRVNCTGSESHFLECSAESAPSQLTIADAHIECPIGKCSNSASTE